MSKAQLLLFVLVATLPIARPLPLSLAYLLLLLLWLQGPWQSVAHDVWDGLLLVGYHLPWPGVGRAEAKDGAWRYVAEG